MPRRHENMCHIKRVEVASSIIMSHSNGICAQTQSCAVPTICGAGSGWGHTCEDGASSQVFFASKTTVCHPKQLAHSHLLDRSKNSVQSGCSSCNSSVEIKGRGSPQHCIISYTAASLLPFPLLTRQHQEQHNRTDDGSPDGGLARHSSLQVGNCRLQDLLRHGAADGRREHGDCARGHHAARGHNGVLLPGQKQQQAQKVRQPQRETLLLLLHRGVIAQLAAC